MTKYPPNCLCIYEGEIGCLMVVEWLVLVFVVLVNVLGDAHRTILQGLFTGPGVTLQQKGDTGAKG